MKTLRQQINVALENKTGIGHFNVATLEMFHGVVLAAQRRDLPVIIGVSESERDFFGIKEIVTLVRMYREKLKIPVYLNADHTYSVERCIEAIDAGFDAVIYDGAKESYEVNLENSKLVVEHARTMSFAENRDILVEVELGYIGSGSKIIDDIPEGALINQEDLTKPEQAQEFMAATEADLLAPAVGNLHGILKNASNPKLDINRIKELYAATGKGMVLHGGSGISDEDLRLGVQAGMPIVHISTEIRIAVRAALEAALNENPDELAPYRYLKGVIETVADVAGQHLDIINPKELTS